MTSRQFARKLFNFVTRYPRALIIGIVLITILLIWPIMRLNLDPSLKSLIPGDHPLVITMEEVDDLFSGSVIIVLAVESDSLLYKPSLIKLKRLHDSLEKIDLVDRVISLFTARDIQSSPSGFMVSSFIDSLPESDEEVDQLKQRLRTRPKVLGNLISPDFRMLAFICQISSSFYYDEHELKREIEAIVEQFQDPEVIYYSGLPITRADVTDHMRRDLRTFTPYALGVMILLLAISFRSWVGVALPFMVVIISTIWTFGLMGLTGRSLPFIGVLIPVMLIAIANNYGIHIIAHYYEYSRLDPEASRGEIIRKTIRSLVIPIFVAGLTTVVGFMSLMGHVLPQIREIGLFVSFGILTAFLLSMLLIPAILSLVPRPRYLLKEKSFTGINRFLVGCGNFFIKKRQPLLWIITAGTILIGMGITRVVVDTNPDKYYSRDSRIRVHNEAISRIFGGSTQISVLIEGDIKDPMTLRNIEKLARHVERHPIVTNTVAITDLIKELNVAFHGGSEEYRRIPEDRNLISQYLFLYSLTENESDLSTLIDDIDEPHNAQLLIRLNKVQASKILEIMDDTQDFIRANFYDSTPMKLSGPATLLGTLARLIVRGQIVSLAVSTLIIFLVIARVFRSLVAGLLSILPLMMAIVLVFGFMGYMGIELTLTTAMLSSILVGVGVDYTVHFLWHLREHIQEGLDLEEAVSATLRISGKGIVYNALSVVTGFAVLLISVFLPVKIFGILIMLSISMCLFGALALLPAVIGVINPKFLYK